VKLPAALLLWISVATGAYAATAADEFGAHRGPAELTVSINTQQDLCRKVLADATALFASNATDLDVSAALAQDLSPLPMTPAIDGTGSPGSSSLLRLDLDLDGDGTSQIVIYRDDMFNWRGDWHYSYVFPSAAAFDAVKSQIATEWLEVPQDAQTPPAGKLDHGAQQYYPSALTLNNEEIATGDVWADHALFEFAHRYFFAAGTTTFDRLRPAPLEIFRLRASGHVERVCSIEQANPGETYTKCQQLPAMRSLLATIRAIGAGGDDGGTLHSGQQHDAQATAAEIRAATRPWATSEATKSNYPGDHPYYQYDQRTRDFLENWSLEELWNRREYQLLLELIAPAETSYAEYLQSAFGIAADTARLDAIQVTQALIAARLEIPNEFDNARITWYFPSTPLHRSVMTRDRSAFDAVLAHPQADTGAAAGRPAQPAAQIIGGALLDSIEWPYGLDRLLASGADPNDANGFGKTVLMIAAHFDRPDSVRRLIKAGADVNAKTSPTPAPDSPQRAGRTALMYAAENAGPAVLRALLDAGANPDVRDSAGNDLAFYLANNPRYTEAERALGVAGLAKAADRYAGPSFDCAKARTPTEHSICASETLRMFDGEIASAFVRLKAAQGGSVLREQQSWIQARDRSCGADADPDCLAELLRTHLRYLHSRLAELATPAAERR
jgi:uncharacterized protein YecT (DUF1311 family)